MSDIPILKMSEFFAETDGGTDMTTTTDETLAVNSLLSKELLQLSQEHRNALQEEIHGVRCLAPRETPELLQDSLRKLAIVLESDEMIPRHHKQAYLQSQSLPRTYINSDDFRL